MVISSMATSVPLAWRGPVKKRTMRARRSFQVTATSLWSSLTSWIVTVRRPAGSPSRTCPIHRYSWREPMNPRRRVTSLTLARPASFRTLFSLSLPFRYWMTATSIPIPVHSWKPASGPSVSPAPRSTRKLNPAYGRSRRTAIASHLLFIDPLEPVEGQLHLLHGHAGLPCVEGGNRPPARPRALQGPRVDDALSGGVQLTDDHPPRVPLPAGDGLAPTEQILGGPQCPAEDDRPVPGLPVIRWVGLRGEAADAAERDLDVVDQDGEVGHVQEGGISAGARHPARILDGAFKRPPGAAAQPRGRPPDAPGTPGHRRS